MEYLDHHLNSLAQHGKSYIKDTNHFLLKLGEIGSIPEGALLCTMDDVGFYTSIPHVEGLEAIRGALDRRTVPEVATETIVELASLVLENNYFEFNDRVFLQKLGTAIGTKFAPAYANLFMNRLEERLLDSWDKKPLVLMRYMDDIFVIWTHGEDCLQEFISYLNSSHRTIKFTSDYSKIALNFLDVSIKVGVGGALETDFFCKPTDTHKYLHSKSCHPWHTKEAIPFSQALRIRRICSDDSSFHSRLGELSEWFNKRGV